MGEIYHCREDLPKQRWGLTDCLTGRKEVTNQSLFHKRTTWKNSPQILVGKYGHQERCHCTGISLVLWERWEQTTRNTQNSVSHADQSENARTPIYIIQQKDMRATELTSLKQWRGTSRGTSRALPATCWGSWAGKTESLSVEQTLLSNSQKKNIGELSTLF